MLEHCLLSERYLHFESEPGKATEPPAQPLSRPIVEFVESRTPAELPARAEDSGSDHSGSDECGNFGSGSDHSGPDHSGNSDSGSDNSGSDDKGNFHSSSDHSGYDDSGNDNSGRQRQRQQRLLTTGVPAEEDSEMPSCCTAAVLRAID